MKRIFPLLVSAHLALGQATVVTCFDEEYDLALPPIGIIPIEDFQKATAEVERLQRELDAVQKKQSNIKNVGAVVAEQKKMVQALRHQLKAAEHGDKQQDKKADFAQREKALVEKVNAMEHERAQATERFQKRVAGLQTGFGRKQGEWERKLMSLEEERDAAIRKHEETELKWVQAEGEWKKSVAKWQKEVEQAVRKAQLAEAQKSVANTARLAADWHAERKELEAQVAELERMRTNESKAWEKSVADWQKKAESAIRTAQVKEAQEAVANTAHLAAAWQTERNALEAQVTEMSAKLVQLEGQLGVQGFEDKQAEVLRLGLMQKSQALESLGADAAKLAVEWKNEREESRRELDAMRDLYKSTAKDVKTRDQRVRQLDSALMEKSQTLELLAMEAAKLSESWKGQRGGLQKKVANLEKQLAACQGKLKDAVKKEKAAQSQAKKLVQEKKGLGGKAKNESQLSAKLAEQLAVAADLQGQLVLAKQREGKLKADFSQLRNEVAELKNTVGDYKSQKEADAEALAALKAELKQVKGDYAASERNLASASAALKKTQGEAKQLKLKSAELAGQLDKARKELEVTRKQAAANQKVKAAADEKAAQVKNLESQLGRLAVAQQELEGTLIATLGDFEKLQKSYIELKAKSADGGEVAKKAMAAREVAEEKLQKLQEKLQGEEAKLQEARKRVQQVEAKKKAAEADAKGEAEAGKAALGKCEAELQKARREMGELQLGQDMLVKEAEALRKRFVNIEPVRYQLASANVVAQQQRVLAEVKQVLEVYPKAKFSINGHTCNIGSEEANLKLSENRAILLRDFLIENGVEEERFTLVEGCGDTEPEASNETDEGRRQNRRVEIEVVR